MDHVDREPIVCGLGAAGSRHSKSVTGPRARSAFLPVILTPRRVPSGEMPLPFLRFQEPEDWSPSALRPLGRLSPGDRDLGGAALELSSPGHVLAVGSTGGSSPLGQCGEGDSSPESRFLDGPDCWVTADPSLPRSLGKGCGGGALIVGRGGRRGEQVPGGGVGSAGGLRAGRA